MRIEDICNFKATVSGDYEEKWEVDALSMPGTPPVGFGKTEVEAKYDCLVKLLEIECYREIIMRELKI